MTSKLSAMLLPGDDSKDNKGKGETDTQEKAPLADCSLDSKADQDERPNKPDNATSLSGNVRFAADDEEIDPRDDTRRLSQAGGVKNEELSPEAHEQIRNLAMTLQKSRLQESRMANFAYETVSMPPSRVRVPFSMGSLRSPLTRRSGSIQR